MKKTASVIALAYGLLLSAGIGLAAEGPNGASSFVFNLFEKKDKQPWDVAGTEDLSARALQKEAVRFGPAASCSNCHYGSPVGAAEDQGLWKAVWEELNNPLWWRAWEKVEIFELRGNQWRLKVVVRGTRQVMTELNHSF